MTVQRQIDQLIAHRASEWVDILKTGGPEEREAFVDWLRESRKNVSEFLAMAVLDDELNDSVFRELVDREALLKRVSPQVTGLQSAPGKALGSPLRRPGARRAHWWRHS